MGISEAVQALQTDETLDLEPAVDLDAPEAEVPAVAAGSVLAAVRNRAQQLQQGSTVDLPLPGYDNLIGRYRAVSLPRIYGKGGQMRNPMGEEWGVGADALAMAQAA